MDQLDCPVCGLKLLGQEGFSLLGVSEKVGVVQAATPMRRIK